MFSSLQTLFGLKGGKRSRRSKQKKQRGGQSCSEQVAGDSSLPQGEAFLKMNQKYHGGRRSRKMRGGAAPLDAAFAAPDASIAERAGTAVLDQAIADLAKFAPQTGGALSGAPIDAPSMLLDSKEQAAAFLNPQWIQENTVNPNFNGPENALVQAPTGGARKSRKARKAPKSRKVRKSRKTMKGGKKSRMNRKGRKGMKGGKKSRKTRRSRKH